MRYALIVLAACKHAGDTPSAPIVPLDRPPPDAAAPAPAIEEVDGVAPASAPVGEPIAITFVPNQDARARMELGFSVVPR